MWGGLVRSEPRLRFPFTTHRLRLLSHISIAKTLSCPMIHHNGRLGYVSNFSGKLDGESGCTVSARARCYRGYIYLILGSISAEGEGSTCASSGQWT